MIARPLPDSNTVENDGTSFHPARRDDEVYVKDYPECEGALAQLVAQGYAEDTGMRVRPATSLVDFPLVRLTAKAKALAPELFAFADG